jgi:3-oxoacyl-[acyl-carrier protein] reductase
VTQQKSPGPLPAAGLSAPPPRGPAGGPTRGPAGGPPRGPAGGPTRGPAGETASGRLGPPPYVPGHGLLEGKVVLVTAAAGAGIGFATARRCLEEGAEVVVSDANERRLEQAAGELASLGGGDAPLAIRCDVTSQDDVAALFDRAVHRHGHLDVVVNNAGLGGEAPIVEMTDEQWSKVIDVTLTGTFRCLRHAMRHMIATGSGVIVNNASVLGWRAQVNQAHYAAAKAGVMALTRTAAMEGAPFGIRVNAVAPSLAMHPFLAKSVSEELLEELVEREAFGRAAEPWEVANVIVFLASDYSSYMTGEVVSVSSQHP